MNNNTAALVQFLKKYSPIPNAFIDDMFELYNPDTAQTDLVVNLDAVAKWLQVPKFKLMTTLRASYKEGVEFAVARAPNPQMQSGRGSNTYWSRAWRPRLSGWSAARRCAS